MTAARRTSPTLYQPRLTGDQSSPAETADTMWPLALRALLLLHGVALPSDPTLTALSEADQIALRGSLVLLSDEPANIA
ncbi:MULTISPECIES: hypothetical protein [Chloroflexus]|uniref:Uncharacterized protein n=1 Tax=Chloroflexus aggregans (strain MD-66 / DSM 9485) TaxID=326427 RepID=B8GCB2_CHLAD|nr:MULTISPECIES: hypothetical protein [Chloroflexus]ACL23086.1 conserved hypothetical protein [Chloroflexus aggregans DSM 9485]GIV89497.1 MAG: hypothetical protein KatS3mg055_2015 [Chloroflexus sp.]